MTHPILYSAGTQVVIEKAIAGSRGRLAQPAGAVAVITKSPSGRDQPYRVRFPDGFEATVMHDGLQRLAEFKRDAIGLVSGHGGTAVDLTERVIFRVVVGSRAFGLDDQESDTDRRGIYLPPAELHWSLAGVPEQIENESTQEAYWEIEKMIVMALKANPNVLETLYSPLVELATPLAQELVSLRSLFLSKLIYQTYNGYVMSQFKKIQADVRNSGSIHWKHVMHLIRLLRAGIRALREETIAVHVGADRDYLLAIKRGMVEWGEIDALRLSMHREFDSAFSTTSLPDRPDYHRANLFLIKARRLALESHLP